MGEKFNAPDPGAMQSTAIGEAGQRSAYMKMQNPVASIGDPDFDMKQSTATDDAGQRGAFKFFRPPPGSAAGVGSPSDDPGAGPDAASRNFEKVRNDNPQAEDAKSVDSFLKVENAKSFDPFLKLENAKSDPGTGPDAASSKEPSGGYDVKKQDRV